MALFAAMGVLALALTALALYEPRFAFGAMIIGGAATFDSSASFTVSKLAYFVFCGLMLAALFPRNPARLSQLSILVASVLLLLTVIGVLFGNPAVASFRGAANYGFLSGAALFAQRFSKTVPLRWVRGVALGFALLSAWGFFASWTSRRGIASFPVFSSASVSALAFAISYTAARALASRRDWIWWPLSSFFVLAGLATGTRSILPMAVAPLLMIVWLRRQQRKLDRLDETERAAGPHVGGAELKWLLSLPIAVFIGFGVSGLVGFDTSSGRERVGSIPELEVASSANRDASLDGRLRQNAAALDALRSEPLIGVGPGHLYTWSGSAGEVQLTSNLDTPLLLFSKWGLIGGSLILYLLWSWGRVLFYRSQPGSFWGLCAVGFFAAILPQALFATITEDKGLPLVLMILGTGRWAEAQASKPDVTSSALTMNRVGRFLVPGQSADAAS